MTLFFRFMAAVLCLASLGATLPEEPQPTSRQREPDDLAAKLIRDTVEQSTSEDPMAAMMRDMSDVAKKLQVDFDPGEHTQTRQRQVSARLDEAIKAAAARRRAQTKPDPKQSADKRTMPGQKKSQPQPPEKKESSEVQAKSAAEKSAAQAEAARQDDKSDLPNLRRAWGNLPQRDREEVLQGAEEESLERFRPWIDQYFRALQESNK